MMVLHLHAQLILALALAPAAALVSQNPRTSRATVMAAMPGSTAPMGVRQRRILK